MVEGRRVPLNFERNLGHTDRVACRAGGGIGETLAGNRVEHMALVVRTIQVLAVPASNFRCGQQPVQEGRNELHLRGKVVGRKDAIVALALGKVANNGPAAAPRHALVAEAGMRLGRHGRTADRHAEALEGFKKTWISTR